MCRSYHCFNIISKNNANNIYFIFIGNHWQIASLVTQKSLFTVTHALFFIHFQFYCFLQMDIFFLRHMIHTLTNLVQLGAISVRAQQCNSTYTSHYANTEGVSRLYWEFPRPSHHSCLTYCAQDPNCEVVTHDKFLDNCRFHFEADDIPCLQIISAPGKSLWVITEFNHHGARHYNVLYTTGEKLWPKFFEKLFFPLVEY